MATNTAPALDATRTFTGRLDALGISKNFFGELVGISSGEISKLLSGAKPIGGEKIEQLDSMLRDLERLVSIFEPCGVGFRNPKQTLRLIEACKTRPAAAENFRHAMGALMESGLSALSGEVIQNERTTEVTTAGNFD